MALEEHQKIQIEKVLEKRLDQKKMVLEKRLDQKKMALEKRQVQ